MFYSALLLAGATNTWNNKSFSPESNDGILSAYEISKLDLHNTKLVVLSACETGIGDVSYDGIVGLQYAFKIAGVKTIIMSLWEVDDQATSLFMSSFYKELNLTHSKEKAFKHARLTVQNKYKNPYYWAAIVMLD